MNTTQIFAHGDLLDFAGNMLERHDCKDLLKPGLLELTGISQHGMGTISGLNDYDYQQLTNLSLGHKQLNQLQTLNKIPIPNEILEHFKHIKCHCMMGLFPEIGRAWLTIDSEIYIWTYEQQRDVAYYDGLSHLIVSVGLIEPRKGVFIKDVKYLMVLTTPIEIIVLGVTFGDTTKTISSPTRNMQSTATYEEMQLMNKPIFVLSTDNVAINVVRGSKNGRIFLGGRDGCLYEIFYQAESSWFGNRCKKINHSQSIVSCMVPSFLKVFSESDPIVRIEIDDSRKLLYVLTDKGSISAWYMSDDFITMRRFATIAHNEIVQSAANIIKTVDSSIFKMVKAICPLTIDDCGKLHLIAVTQCGVRFYFSTVALNLSQYNLEQQQQYQLQMHQQTQPTQYTPSNSPTQSQHMQQPPRSHSPHKPNPDVNKPHGLFLLHVRLPPGYTPNTTINKPKQVHSAHYNEGTMLLVSTPQPEQDMMWSISSAPFPTSINLMESTTVLPLDGIVWSLAEVRDRCRGKLRSLLRNARTPKKVVLLTNQGAHIFALLKPTDILHQLLIACNGPHHEAIKAYFHVQGAAESCVTCLLITCAEQYRGTDVAMWAAQAFMLYGGEPSFQGGSAVNSHLSGNSGNRMNSFSIGPSSAGHSPNMYMSTPMPNAAINLPRCRTPISNASMPQHTQYPLSPISHNQSKYGPGPGEHTSIVYSAKHDGLYLYVARMMRPIWKRRCVDNDLCSNISREDCKLMLEDLCALKVFLEANSVNDLSATVRSTYNGTQASMPINNGYSHIMMPNNTQPINGQRNATEQAHAEEKRSLTALNFFIKQTCEVISLWQILCNHHFQQLARQLSNDQQIKLKCCTFRDLTLSRSETCAFLIVALINTYLKDNASVTSISSSLRDVCPNLYRNEDAVTYKATEILMTAKNCTSLEERNEKLRIALQLCKDAAPTLPLQSICQQFIIAEFFEGVVELTATCAQKCDPEEVAIHYYNSDEPSDDREGYTAYATRMTCYKEVRLMLDHVYQIICNNNANLDMTRQQYLSNSLIIQSTDEANNNPNGQIMKIIRQAVQLKDPLLHVTVYEWLMSHDMLSELLGLIEPSLGEFLRRRVGRHPENLKLIDLLWKYYEKNGNHAQAARILDNLAITESDSIPLDLRIEYLARAVMCMRNESVGSSISNGIFLKELEDKLEIARVQKSVLDEMSAISRTNRDAVKAVEELNCMLYDITQLYQNFADPFELWECQLTILNCSHHNDPLLIESVWGNIIKNAIDGPGTMAERCTRLFTKIETLARLFGDSGHCFPLSFLIRELEIKACQLRLPEGIVPEKLVGMNIDVELLMEYYSRMITMNERVWANEGNEWHLVLSSIRVVTLLANNAQSIWYRSKRRIVGKAQDIVASCLNLCYQKPNTDHLQQSLKELQCRLQRALT